MVSYGVNQNMGWGGGFYWQGGGAQAYPGEVGYSSPPLFSSYFGWQIICGWSTCNGTTKPGEISVLGLELEAAEGSGPSVFVTPGSLGAASGWVRGTWPIAFSADGPTGACQLAASLAGASVSQPLNEPQSQVTWHQCPAGSFSQSFNTAAVASGAGVPLVMWARDAAYDYSAGHYLSGTATSYVNVDNDPVSVSVSGPTDAPSTAGTQYVTATGNAGPSGVSGIGCSADGAPYQWYPKQSVQIPVGGIGVHRVTCYSANNARDAAGHVATSAAQTWTLSIREPTVSGIGFGKLVDPLLCKRVTKRVKVPAHWVTVRRHHKRVRVKRRARTKLERVTRCHPRIVRRRITVWKTVKRHGKNDPSEAPQDDQGRRAAARRDAQLKASWARQANHSQRLARAPGRDCPRRSSRGRPHRAGQRARPLHAGCSCHDGGERQLERRGCQQDRRGWSRLITRARQRSSRASRRRCTRSCRRR